MTITLQIDSQQLARLITQARIRAYRTHIKETSKFLFRFPLFTVLNLQLSSLQLFPYLLFCFQWFSLVLFICFCLHILYYCCCRCYILLVVLLLLPLLLLLPSLPTAILLQDRLLKVVTKDRVYPLLADTQALRDKWLQTLNTLIPTANAASMLLRRRTPLPDQHYDEKFVVTLLCKYYGNPTVVLKVVPGKLLLLCPDVRTKNDDNDYVVGGDSDDGESRRRRKKDEDGKCYQKERRKGKIRADLHVKKKTIRR